MRVGIGYDIHRLVPGRKLVLGGAKIPYRSGLLGYSDGDVLYHAIVDAALGAAGLGDIGEYFSDRDPKNKGQDSFFFIKKTRALLAKKGLAVAQIDSILILEQPKLSGFKKEMKQNLSKNWGVAADRVNVKAKTNEGLGAAGRGQAIACHAVVMLESLKRKKK